MHILAASLHDPSGTHYEVALLVAGGSSGAADDGAAGRRRGARGRAQKNRCRKSVCRKKENERVSSITKPITPSAHARVQRAHTRPHMHDERPAVLWLA